MTGLLHTHYAPARPLTDSGSEMATRWVKIILAERGAFGIAGHDRQAFVVSARVAPIEVAYRDVAACTEWRSRPSSQARFSV